MDEIIRVEFMTSRNPWDPTKYDSPEGESERLIKQMSPLPFDIIDSFVNDQGDIRVTKGDSIAEPTTKANPTVVEPELE